MFPEIWIATGIIFLHFRPFFLDRFFPFYPRNNPENQNFEKMEKTPGDVIVLHKCTKKHGHMHTGPEIWCVTDVIFIFHFGPFTPTPSPPPPPPPAPPNEAKKLNFEKTEKHAWRYHHVMHVYQKL